MLLQYFYDPKLAHASYLVGCQRTGEAIVVDPGRDVEQYLATATDEEMTIVGIAETHIHADYVSGARELADRVGARLYVSDEGHENWKYEFAGEYDATLLKDGDRFNVGNIRFDVLHTPGHTPESISFLLTDEGGGADRPMGIFTGDFVFVGSIGRPDLLEKAAGARGTAESGARAMFNSLERFKTLPDYVQVWPAHGAGSACGKGLGAIPSSTVGYEKLFNPALAYQSEGAFVEYLLADQPEVPPYFREMKRVNKVGPALLRTLPQPVHLPVERLPETTAAGAQVLDVRDREAYADGYVPGTLNIPVDALAQWAGWLVDYNQPLYLMGPSTEIREVTRVLHKLGVDATAGYFDSDEIELHDLNRERYEVATPAELAGAILNNEVMLVDVRAESEWAEGRLPHAHHIMLGSLPERLDEVVNGRPIVMQCRTGNRSAIAASIVTAAGGRRVINMDGGYRDWAAAGLPIER